MCSDVFKVCFLSENEKKKNSELENGLRNLVENVSEMEEVGSDPEVRESFLAKRCIKNFFFAICLCLLFIMMIFYCFVLFCLV